MNKFVLKTSAFRLSDEEFYNFCRENRDLHIERNANQDIIIMSPTGYITGDRNSEITRQLGNWNKKSKSGRVFDSSTGFALPNGAVKSPDAAWISHEHDQQLSPEDRKKFAPVCPDFVIELKSENDDIPELQNKMVEWIENGCRLGWLIDADEEKVYIYQPKQPVCTIEGFNNTVDGGEVLPGFILELSELRV